MTAVLLATASVGAWAADPRIATFIDTPDPVPAGGIVSYAARVDNPAVDAATSVRVVVPVPSGTTFVSATAPCALAGASVECDLGSVGANGSDARNLSFVFRALGPGPASVVATATLTSGNDDNAGNNVQSQTTTVSQGGDLSLLKTGTPNPVVGGGNLTYTLTASNAGPNASGALVLTDTLPPAVTYVSAGGIGWTCAQAGGIVTCTRPGPHAAGAGTIPPVTVVGKVNASGGTVTNSATIAPAAGGTADPDAGNNTATLDTTVLPGADVNIAQKTLVSGAPAAAGTAVTFQIQPRNAGPVAAVNAVVTDALPAVAAGAVGWSVVSASGPNWSCGVSASTVSCARASFPVGAADNITVVARAPPNATVGSAGTTYINTASIASDSSDPTTTNNTGSVAVPVLPSSSLAGTIFQDSDRTGANAGTPQPLGTELRLAGVTVRLTGTDASGRAVDRSITTDVFGNYAFPDLSPSDAAGYTLTETQPAGYTDSPASPPTSGPLAPSAGGTYASSNGGAGNTTFTGIVLGAGVAAVNYNFPELRRSSLSGFVYIDLNLNGVRDAAVDAPVPGATVRLLNAASGALVATAVTDADGAYAFPSIARDIVYTLEQPLPATPAGLQNGPVNPGQVNGAACASGCTVQPDTPVAGTDRIAFIDLASGNAAGAGANFNFGERRITAVAGLVYVDADRDNALGAVDTARLAGVTIRLVQGADCASGTTLQTQTTVADGSYRFDSVLAFQNYLVCETQPAGYGTGNAKGVAGSNAIALANLPVVGSLDNHFGETLASLAGSVYQDNGAGTPSNADNGARDAGEPGIAGVPVALTGRDITGTAVSLAATTDASGNFRFDGLLQSDAAGYAVAEGAIPASSGIFSDGKDTAGSAGGSVAVNDRIGAVVLTAGVQATGYLFGELPNAGISGSVYLDRNRNGAFDGAPTDAGLAGVGVRLVQGASCAAGSVLQTATTAADGSYAFAGIAAGQAYLVCETQPAGYAEGAVNPGAGATSPAASVIAIASLPAGGSAGNRFGERAASLAGSVFLDANNDGSRTGDAGLSGVAFTLSGVDASGAPVSRAASSDASGTWRFDDLPAAGPGGYTVTEQAAQPVAGGTATLNGRTAAGSVGGIASAVTVVPSAVSGIALAAGADATGYDFGEILPSTLAGTVFLDLNNNGVQNAPGEVGLAGVAIVLTGTDDSGAAVSRNVVSGADGSYAFSGLRPGSYAITEPTQPASTSNGLTVAGSAGGTPTAPATTPSAIAGIVLAAPGTQATGYNFAELAASGSLAGRVWLDADNDGSVNGAEAGIAGVTVELAGTDLSGAAVARSAVTDAQGNYAFANLLPGSYTVREPSQPAGTLNGRTNAGNSGGTPTAPATTPSAVGAITLTAGQSLTGVSFGELPAAAVSGRVYADNNNNGRIDSGEAGIPGVGLRLTGTDDLGSAVSLAATTDAAGAYAFAGLRPGAYTVTEPTQPPGTANGITSAGTVAGAPLGTATPPAVAPSAVSGIALVPGAQSVDNNFGEIGSSPDLVVAKASVEARFTVANVGSYTVRVRNAGSAPTAGAYTVTDRLPAGLTLDATPAGAGWSCTGAAGAQIFSCTGTEVLAAGAASANAVTVRVRIAAAALAASPVSNVVLVEGGGEIDARAPSAAERDAFAANPAALPACDPAVLHNACRAVTTVQAAASVSGTVWYDTGSASHLLDSGDRRLKGWLVEVLDAGGSVVARAVTADDGSYRVADLLPGVTLGVRFRDPQSNVIWGYPVNGETAPGSSGAPCDPAAALAAGTASSCPGGGATPALSVVLAAGQNLPQQSLPLDPGGVVYDSGTRQPVAGSVVTLAPVGSCPGWNPATGLVGATLGGYTVNGAAVSTTVGSDGYYQLLFAPAAPASCTFGLTVTPPAGWHFPSTLIAPAAGTLTPPGAAGSAYAVQPQAAAPSGAVGPATIYYLAFTGGAAVPSVVHNHLPLDADALSGLSLQKTGDKSVAEVGDSVRYTITVQKTSGALPLQTTIVDRLPAGFTYINGTAQVGGVAVADPAGRPGPRLTFELGPMPASGQLVLQYRVRVGVGAQQGDGLNRARGYACNVPASCVAGDGFTPLPTATATNEGQHRVRVNGGVFTTDACVLGKIFVDCNNNHVQDAEELGIPGVRLLFSDGTFLVSDSEGKYSYCGLPPRSHVLRVDPYTLPRGSRLTTTSNRNLADAGSLWLDLKNGELHRADFAEGSCSNTVLDQVKARRAQGEVRSVEAERRRGPALRFDSKAHGLDALSSPRQGTDGANQLAPKTRDARAAPDAGPVADETNVPTTELPMNRPPPPGRGPGDAPDATPAARSSVPQGAPNAAR